MWIRRCQIDAKLEAPLPIPTQIVSNEEFIPPEQSPQQEEVEARTLELASEPARLQGMSRRQFLRTGSGMATGLMAFNQVFGDCFEVSAETEKKEIMGIRHKDWFMEGIQFHPESILTVHGKDLLKNFLALPARSKLEHEGAR